MKKTVLVFIFFITALSVFGQRIYTVGVLPFEASGEGVSPGVASEAERLIRDELSPVTTLTVLPAAQAAEGEYLINGQISFRNNQIALTATITQASTGKTLNTVREQGSSLNAISMSSVCAQLCDYIPYPAYITGKWQSTINTNDGPVTCILEFRPDRTATAEQYDTWEHKGTNLLKYQAIGTGTYSFTGYHIPRTVTVEGRRILVNAAFGINLTLEDALPKYNIVNVTGSRILFNDTRSGFEIVNGGIPCGDNYTGPSVYPGEKLFYTGFSKIR